MFVHHFQADEAGEVEVVGEVDGSHAPLPQQGVNAIPFDLFADEIAHVVSVLILGE